MCIDQRSRLLNETQAAKQHDESLNAEDDTKSDESTNNTSNGSGDVAVVGRLGRRSAVGGVGGAAAVGVAAGSAPVRGVGDGKLVDASLEVVPANARLLLAKQGEGLEAAVLGSSAVGPEEANGQIVLRELSGAGGDELEHHGGGVVADAVEIVGGSGQLSKAEEGHEGGVGTKLDVELGNGLAVGDTLESSHDLASENGTRNGADGIAAVIGEVPLMGRGEVIEVRERGFGEEVVRGDGGVVNCGDIDVVKDFGKGANVSKYD